MLISIFDTFNMFVLFYLCVGHIFINGYVSRDTDKIRKTTNPQNFFAVQEYSCDSYCVYLQNKFIHF